MDITPPLYFSMGQARTAYRTLVREPEGNKPFGRIRPKY